MNIAYVCSSPGDQHPGRQLEALSQCNIERTYEERISSKDMNRPELKKMLSFVREGDTVFIESINRIANNTMDFFDLVEKLNELKVTFVSQKENIDTSTPPSQFMLSVFAALSQLERNTTSQQQQQQQQEDRSVFTFFKPVT